MNEKKSPLNLKNKRRVNFKSENVKFRAVTEEINGQQVRMLKGYPILFNSVGYPYIFSDWAEIIAPGALDSVDFSNLYMLFNHNTDLVLGKAGKNLTYEIDDTGLFVTVILGNTQLDDYVFDRVQRGLVDSMSFWFDYAAEFTTDMDNMTDTITKINAVYEVSIVTFPAYEETVVIADEENNISGGGISTINSKLDTQSKTELDHHREKTEEEKNLEKENIRKAQEIENKKIEDEKRAKDEAKKKALLNLIELL